MQFNKSLNPIKKELKILKLETCDALMFWLIQIAPEYYTFWPGFKLMEGWSRLVMIPALHAGGHGFKSHPLHTDNDKYRNIVNHHWLTNDTNF